MNEVYNTQPFTRTTSIAPIILNTWSPTRYLATYHAPGTKYSPFTKEIENLFLYDKNKQFIGIPRYAIVDKKGKLAIDNAARPSAIDEIKKHLETVLRHNE